MNKLVWAAQFLLAAIFITLGSIKVFMQINEMAEYLPWVREASPQILTLIGICELAGGFGVLIPSLTRIYPILTSYAAIGLSATMLFASVFTIARGEIFYFLISVSLLALSLLVAYGRWEHNSKLKKNAI